MLKEFYFENRPFLTTLFAWMFCGLYLTSFASMIVLVTLLLFVYKNRHLEMFFGLYSVLYFSDSYFYGFQYAHEAKGYYIFLMGIIYIMRIREFGEFNNFVYSFVPFLIFACCRIPASEIPGVCFQKTVSYFLILLMVPNFVIFLYKQYGDMFFKSFILLMISFIGLGILFRFFHISPVSQGRFSGFMGNPNAIGLYCTSLFLLLLVVRQYFPLMFTRKETIILYVIIGTAMFLCGSRNAYFTVAIMLFFHRFYRISPFFGFIILAIALLLYDIFLSNIHPIIQFLGLGTVLREETLDSGSGRLVGWAFGWEQIKLNFFFGKGIAHDEYIYYAGDNQLKLNLAGHDGAAHNSFISLMLDVGLFGTVLFLYALLRKFFIAAKNTKIAFPVLFAVLFSANFESWLIGSLNPYTILIIVALTIMTCDEFNKEPQEDTVPLL